MPSRCPGDFFYVNSGLILHADEESELAGVMAHEIAHVCAGAPRHEAGENQGPDRAAGFDSRHDFHPLHVGWVYAIYQGMNFAIPAHVPEVFYVRTKRGSRDVTSGLQYMYKAGYDPNSFVMFFEKIQADEKKQPGTIPKIFSDHPPTPDRIQMIQKEIATILPPREDYIVTTSAFDSVKHRLEMIENNVKLNDAKNNANKPTLRKRTDQEQGRLDRHFYTERYDSREHLARLVVRFFR